MPIPKFTDPRQVAIYDAVNSYEPGTQPDFYLGVAEGVSIRYASGAPDLDLWQAVFQSGGRSLWERVGVRVDQLNIAGAYSDAETFVLTRERWEAAASEIWDRCG